VAKLSSPGDLPDVVRHDVSPENIKSLVGAGRGVSLMCEACMGANYAGVVYREARDGTGSTRIGYRAGNGKPGAAKLHSPFGGAVPAGCERERAAWRIFATPDPSRLNARP
jgi:hypothetical protein